MVKTEQRLTPEQQASLHQLCRRLIRGAEIGQHYRTPRLPRVAGSLDQQWRTAAGVSAVHLEAGYCLDRVD